MANKTGKTHNKRRQPTGLTRKEDVPANKDKHIDQDFPGYPHQPAGERTINPQTEDDKINANLKTNNDPTPPEETSVGSANAFEATEGGNMLREELDDDNPSKDKQKNYY